MIERRRGCSAGWLAALAALLMAWANVYAQAPTQSPRLELVDDQGQRLSLAAPAQRIVSLLPSLSETVCALGACERLVGVDRYSNYPPALESRANIGGGLDPNIEAIVVLKPDLVLAARSTRALARLRALGLPVLVLEPQNTAQFLRATQTLAKALGVASAAPLLGQIERDIQRAAQQMPARARGARLYFEAGPGPYAAGPQSFIGELLLRLGLQNIAPPQSGAYPKLNPEYVVKADPALIVVVDSEAAQLAHRPGWAQLSAVRAGRVCQFSAQQSDVLMRAGPRMAEAAALLARCVAQHL